MQEETNINWSSSSSCLLLLPHYISHLLCLLLFRMVSRYNLCNFNDTQTVASRTTLLYNSFRPSPFRDWIRLNPHICNAGMLNDFKHKLNQNITTQE